MGIPFHLWQLDARHDTKGVSSFDKIVVLKHLCDCEHLSNNFEQQIKYLIIASILPSRCSDPPISDIKSIRSPGLRDNVSNEQWVWAVSINMRSENGKWKTSFVLNFVTYGPMYGYQVIYISTNKCCVLLSIYLIKSRVFFSFSYWLSIHLCFEEVICIETSRFSYYYLIKSVYALPRLKKG